MAPKPLSAEHFDGWYANQAARPAVAEIMNRHMGFPPDTRAGVVSAEAIPELAEELRLSPGSTLLDLACGRGAYGLLVASKPGRSSSAWISPRRPWLRRGSRPRAWA